MTWKNIEDEFNTQSQANIETIKVNGECCFVCGFKPYGVSDFFKAKFKEVMEEMVGKISDTAIESDRDACFECGWDFKDCNCFQTELYKKDLLNRIETFFK